MTKVQIDQEVKTANTQEAADILAAQNDSTDLASLAAAERANRKIAYDKFIELGLSVDVALTISGWVENPTPPREVVTE